MKIAVPAAEKDIQSQVSITFGRSLYFIIVESDTMDFQAIENQAVNAQGGAGILAAQTVLDSGAEVLVTPHLGQNAADVLKRADIEIMQAVPGTVKDLVDMYKNGELKALKEIHPGYHGGHR